ncbi:MAG: methyltransferase family protein [Alphaproteobacteria bacterium]
MKEFLKPPFVPPFWLLLAVIAMVSLDQVQGQAVWILAPYSHAGWVLIGAGLSLALYVELIFKRKGTTILPFRQSNALVLTGPFRISRNPIYVGMAAALLGLGVMLGTAWPFGAVPIFVWVIDRYFIRREEVMLEAAFGADYRDYKTRVRRWI